MFADCSALFGDISPMVFGVESSGENFIACIKILALAKHGDYSGYFAYHSPNHWCMVAMPKSVYRESIGRLEKPRGTVALHNHVLLEFGDASGCNADVLTMSWRCLDDVMAMIGGLVESSDGGNGNM